MDQDPITLTIAGTEYTLPELNTYDKHRLRREYRKVEKGKVLESAQMAGLDPEQTFRALADYDADPPSDWVQYLNGGDGIFLALQISLEKALAKPGENGSATSAKKEAERLVTQITTDEGELNDIVGRLANLRRVPVGTDGKPLKRQVIDDLTTYGSGGGSIDDREPTVYGDEADPTRAAATVT